MKLILSALLPFFLLACSGSGGNDDNGSNGGSPQVKNRVNWDNIPAEFNPRIQDDEYKFNDVNYIEMNFFGFDQDVEVLYRNDLDKNTFLVRTYTVYKTSYSWGATNESFSSSGDTFRLSKSGTYECSIKTENGNITSLEGGCIVRIQVFMPTDAKVEVYNVGGLLTKRFFGMTVDRFFEKFEDASFADGKHQVIDEFINSYKGTGDSLELQSKELGEVIKDFSFKDDKMSALKKLHGYVTDRENLGAMIDDVFTSSWDREEAREIVGL